MRRIFVWLSSFFKKEINRIILALVFFVPAFVLEHISEGASEHTEYIIALSLYLVALLISGVPVFFSAVRGIIRGDFLDEKFLMSIASVGAMIIGEMSEGVAVMLFFLVGEYFEHRAVAHSRKSIRALMEIKPDEATVVLEDGSEEVVDAEDVAVGSIIVIRAGERVPVDAQVIWGSADINTSAITGEAMPRSALPGDTVESGSVVEGGVIKCKTLRPAEESCASRILELVENASDTKSKTESFITKFSRFYTPIVVGLAVLMAILPPLFFDSFSFERSIYSALTFLVISCPCALVISVPMAFFGGIGAGARHGVLFKGGNVFSPLTRCDTFAFDKTGTLTTGSFAVSDVVTVGISREELLYYSASAEYGSTHPLAICIKNASEKSVIPTEYHETSGKGIVATVDGKQVVIGNENIFIELGIALDEAISKSGVLVAIDGEYKGQIIVKDSIKDEAEETIRELKRIGVKRFVMLSGDKKERADEVAEELSLTSAYSELLPEDKYARLEELRRESEAVAFVGDGINDAPSLALSDVGIAMGAIGTDSAIESADVVIMSDNLSRLPLAVRIARKTLRIARTNIVFALGVKLLVMVLGALGIANMWLAVFADVGVAVLAILNSIRTLRYKG